MEIIKADSRYHHALCVYLRTVIFIQGQNCPRELEIEPNENEAKDYVAIVDGAPVATGRYRIIDDHIGKIERVGVLAEFQGAGYGKKVMLHIIEELKQLSHIDVIKLSAQDHAIPFYEKIGFSVMGDGYIEAGIPHHTMKLAA